MGETACLVLLKKSKPYFILRRSSCSRCCKQRKLALPPRGGLLLPPCPSCLFPSIAVPVPACTVVGLCNEMLWKLIFLPGQLSAKSVLQKPENQEKSELSSVMGFKACAGPREGMAQRDGSLFLLVCSGLQCLAGSLVIRVSDINRYTYPYP